MLTIGDLSRSSGVKIPTIRYYEQMGLLSHSERSVGNQRRYTDEERERLTFIRHARNLGLSIEAIRELIQLNQHPERPCRDADRIAAERLADVRSKIKRLTKLEEELVRITTCDHSNQVGNCYVIRALASHDLWTHEQH